MAAKAARRSATKALASKLLNHIQRRRNRIAQEIKRLRLEALSLARQGKLHPK
jgi:hypothetical protein